MQRNLRSWSWLLHSLAACGHILLSESRFGIYHPAAIRSLRRLVIQCKWYILIYIYILFVFSFCGWLLKLIRLPSRSLLKIKCKNYLNILNWAISVP